MVGQVNTRGVAALLELQGLADPDGGHYDRPGPGLTTEEQRPRDCADGEVDDVLGPISPEVGEVALTIVITWVLHGSEPEPGAKLGLQGLCNLRFQGAVLLLDDGFHLGPPPGFLLPP